MTLIERLKTEHGVAANDLTPEELAELKWLFQLGVKIQGTAIFRRLGWIETAAVNHPWMHWHYRLKQ